MPEKMTDKMRPCVKAALEDGAQNKDHLKKMTFAIIFELNRLNIEKSEIKMVLMEWNQKNYRKLTEGEAKRQLCDFVEWFFKHECKMSCNALNDYCLFPNGGCRFKPIPYQENIELPFSMLDAESFLMSERMPHGYLMACLLKILFKIQREKNARAIIYIGLRTLRARVLDEFRHDLDPKDILRALNKLEEEGFIRITHGERGTFSKRANGYTFQPWTRQQPIITHMCGNSETHYCVATKEAVSL